MANWSHWSRRSDRCVRIPAASPLKACGPGAASKRGALVPLARLASAAHRTRLTLPQVRLLDDPQVAHRHRLSVLSACDDVPNAVTQGLTCDQPSVIGADPPNA